MPFAPDTKAKMFIKSARICCLCYKPCGVNIEAAHIIAEADGGSNDEENGIPLCFDCHQETGGYDKRHPKGNKFTEIELKERRNKVYDLVEKGILQAQIVASKMHSSILSNKEESSVVPVEKEYKPSHEVYEIIDLSKQPYYQNFPLKLNLLNAKEQAFVIDTLLKSTKNLHVLNTLLAICRSEDFADKHLIILEQVLRKATISNDLDIKNELMSNVDVKLFKNTDEGLRIAFFSDIINVLNQNQFKDVNRITRNVVEVQEVIPEKLRKDYITALFGIATSNAWTATPIAKKALLNLSEEFVKIIIEEFNVNFLLWNRDEIYKNFLNKHKGYWPNEKQVIFEDFISLSPSKFSLKYDTEDDE